MEPNDISPIDIVSKKNQADAVINMKAVSHEDSTQHGSTKKRRPKAKGKLKSNIAGSIYRGELYADSRKMEDSLLNTRFRGLALNEPKPPSTPPVKEWPHQPSQEHSTITQTNPFCMGIVNHQGVKKSTPLSESSTRRGKGVSHSSPSKPVTYVDALSKVKLTPTSATEAPSPTTRMKIKDRMKNSHKATNRMSSHSKSLHRQSSKQMDEDSKPAKGSQDGKDPWPGKAKYRAMSNVMDVDVNHKNKKSKQIMRDKFIVRNLLHSLSPTSNVEGSSFESLILNSEGSDTTPLMQSRYIKKLIDDSNEDLPKTGDDPGTEEVVPGHNVCNSDEDTVKSKPPSAAVIPTPNKILLPMEVDSKEDENCIVMNETDFHDTRAIDELIAKLTEFSIDHCLFFHPNDLLGREHVIKIEQKFKFSLPSSSSKQKRSFQYMSLLHKTAQCGQLHSVKHLIEKYSARVDVQDCCGRTPLMLSLSNPSVVHYLVTMGANVNHQDKNGICPVSLLVSSDTTNAASCKETLFILIKAGADLLLVDKFGRSILYYALVGSNREVISVLLEACPFIPNSRIGQFTFAGKPLLTQWKLFDTVNLSVKYFLKLPDSLKLSVEYLNAVTFTADIGRINTEDFKAAFTKLEAVLADKEKLKVTIDYPLPLPAYSNHKEVQTVEELKEIENNEKDGTDGFCFKIAFQCLLIVERILGHGNYNSIIFLHFITERLLNKVETSTSTTLWSHYIEMLAHHVKLTESLPSIAVALEHAVSNMSRITFDDGETKKYQNMLLQALVTFYQNLNDFHDHNDNDHINDFNYHSSLALDFLKYLLKFGDNSQVSKFLNDLPKYPCGYLLMEMALTFSLSDHIDRCLEVAGAKILNVPNYFRGITFLHKYHPQDPIYKAEMIAKLISYGAHPDTVDVNGSTPWQKNKTKIRQKNSPSDDSSLQSMFKPSSLYCLAANSVISFKFPYRTLDLPQHVKAFVSIHDKDMYPLKRMELWGLVHHGFKFEEEDNLVEKTKFTSFD